MKETSKALTRAVEEYNRHTVGGMYSPEPVALMFHVDSGRLWVEYLPSMVYETRIGRETVVDIGELLQCTGREVTVKTVMECAKMYRRAARKHDIHTRREDSDHGNIQ